MAFFIIISWTWTSSSNKKTGCADTVVCGMKTLCDVYSIPHSCTTKSINQLSRYNQSPNLMSVLFLVPA